MPTAERDSTIGLSIFKPSFGGVRALMYNSAEERAMIPGIAGNQDVPSVVVGVGSEVPANPQPRSHLMISLTAATSWSLIGLYQSVGPGLIGAALEVDSLTALGGIVAIVLGVAGLVQVLSRDVAYPVARGTCAAYFPEANVLVPLDSTADISGTPTSKSVVVRFEPSSAPL